MKRRDLLRSLATAGFLGMFGVTPARLGRGVVASDDVDANHFVSSPTPDTKLTLAKIREAKAALDEYNWHDETEYHLVITEAQYEALVNDLDVCAPIPMVGRVEVVGAEIHIAERIA